LASSNSVQLPAPTVQALSLRSRWSNCPGVAAMDGRGRTGTDGVGDC
jgi:hypothetical protein